MGAINITGGRDNTAHMATFSAKKGILGNMSLKAETIRFAI
jgi:hypothetical protein